jgi:hypothetical protein
MQPLADRVVLADVGRGHPIYFAPVAATPGFAEPLFRLVREPRRGAMTPGREASMSAGRCAF